VCAHIIHIPPFQLASPDDILLGQLAHQIYRISEGSSRVVKVYYAALPVYLTSTQCGEQLLWTQSNAEFAAVKPEIEVGVVSPATSPWTTPVRICVRETFKS